MLSDIIELFKSYINQIVFDEVIGTSVLEIITLFLIIIFAFYIRDLFANYVVKKIEYFVKKTSNNTDNLIFDVLVGPFKLLPIVVVVLILGFQFNSYGKINSILAKINLSLVSLFIFWLLYSCFVLFSNSLSKLEKLFSKGLTIWLIKSIRYLIIFLGAVSILDVWGIKIGPIIAGLGLFGVAVALGAQDLFKNLISGILILIEKKFQIGNIINVPNYGEGTVEHIGFRSTTIRKFDSTPLILPNYILADSAISNFTNRHHRRINWIIGLNYSTSIFELKSITTQIGDLIIKNQDDFVVNAEYNCYVRIEKFNDSSIDILVYCFTKTTDWKEFLEIREKLALNIKEIVEEKNKCSFAFPSQSIYIEKK